MASGGLAGSISLAFFYSFDNARNEFYNSAKRGREKQYKGIIDVYLKILANRGVAGLYRGFMISCVGVAINRGLYFGLYDTIKQLLRYELKNNFIFSFTLGWAITFLASLACYPIDTIRRRMIIIFSHTAKFSSPINSASKILASGGVFSFFEGAGANILRSLTGAGAISGYDYIQHIINPNTKS